MKTTFTFFLLAFGLIGYGQQNFINVPSAEVTAKNKLFFQQQININEIIQSNSTLACGLGKGFEIGVNVLGLNFKTNQQFLIENDSFDKDPYNPLILLNGLKSFKINNQQSIALGTQVGFNYTERNSNKPASLTYLNYRITDLFLKNSVFVLGSYYNTLHYGGEGDRIGFWLASEIVLNDKLHFMAESVMGKNALAYTSLGVIYYPLKYIPLTFGIQIPNTENNAYSFVFELTILPINNEK